MGTVSQDLFWSSIGEDEEDDGRSFPKVPEEGLRSADKLCQMFLRRMLYCTCTLVYRKHRE